MFSWKLPALYLVLLLCLILPTSQIAFAAFFLVLGLAMERLGIAIGFLAATATTLAVHAVSWRVLRRRKASGKA